MSFEDDLAAAKAERPEPVPVEVAVGAKLYTIEVRRLDGMEWAGITSECPPHDEKSAALGYDTNRAALLACRRFSRLLDADGEVVDTTVKRDEHGNVLSDRWADVFAIISGVEVGQLAATWWALNMHDPNQKVVELKKASLAGKLTSSD